MSAVPAGSVPPRPVTPEDAGSLCADSLRVAGGALRPPGAHIPESFEEALARDERAERSIAVRELVALVLVLAFIVLRQTLLV